MRSRSRHSTIAPMRGGHAARTFKCAVVREEEPPLSAEPGAAAAAPNAAAATARGASPSRTVSARTGSSSGAMAVASRRISTASRMCSGELVSRRSTPRHTGATSQSMGASLVRRASSAARRNDSLRAAAAAIIFLVGGFGPSLVICGGAPAARISARICAGGTLPSGSVKYKASSDARVMARECSILLFYATGTRLCVFYEGAV